MTNYRIQNSCANCRHLVRSYALYEGPDQLHCDRLKLADRAIISVVENGICDDYEKRLLVQTQTESGGRDAFELYLEQEATQ